MLSQSHQSTHFQAITPVRLPVDHVQQLILNLPTSGISCRPIITRPGPLFQHEDVLWIVNVSVRAVLYALNDTGLEVEENSAGDVARVVGLVEEDILTVAALNRIVSKVAGLVDAVFLAELLPELGADWEVAQSVMVADEGW